MSGLVSWSGLVSGPGLSLLAGAIRNKLQRLLSDLLSIRGLVAVEFFGHTVGRAVGVGVV